MSGEIFDPLGITGRTVYVIIFNKTGKAWNTASSAFETYNTANRSDYDVPLTEQGTASKIYVADFPAAITGSGTYEWVSFIQGGALPAETDARASSGRVDWTGSAAVSSETGSMTGSDWYAYILRSGFIRTDKVTEALEATTDAIQEMRRRFMFDEAEAETTTTDTISALGDFKLSVESDFGLLLGIVLEDDDTGTPLKHVTKWQFDQLYPSINIENDRGYPQHFAIYAGQIYIGPIPDSVSYFYRKSYSRRAGAITLSTTGVPFTNLYRDILCDLVMSKLYKGLEEYDQSRFYAEEFERKFPLAVRRERINSGEHCFTMRVLNI